MACCGVLRCGAALRCDATQCPVHVDLGGGWGWGNVGVREGTEKKSAHSCRAAPASSSLSGGY